MRRQAGCTCRGLTLCPWCQTLAARAGVIPPRLDAAHQLSEKAFQDGVLRLLKDTGHMVYHTHESRRSPQGWPDVAAIKPTGGTLYLCELKTDTGQVTLAQQAWLEALAGCTGVVAECWRPSALDAIVAKLRA